MESSPHTNLVLFDGVCNLCNGFVKFLIRQDHRQVLSYGTLQSEEIQKILMNAKFVGNSDTVVYMRHGSIFTRSSAVLRILRDLGGLWHIVVTMYVIPRAFRDYIYRYIARNRHRIWGKRKSCMVPTADLKKRFIS